MVPCPVAWRAAAGSSTGGCWGGSQDLEVGHSYIDALPGDPDTTNKRRQVTAARPVRQLPAAAPAAKLIKGLTEETLRLAELHAVCRAAGGRSF